MTARHPAMIVVGTNHEYAPVEIREKLAFSGDQLVEALDTLSESIPEVMILSTCNRTEIYAVGDSIPELRSEIFSFLTRYHSIGPDMLSGASYVQSGEEAVDHLFHVATGLNSMILGEPQILSQIREALDLARQQESVGPVMQRVALDALRVGKRARTETDIARNRMSIAHAAVDLAAHEMGSLEGVDATIIGAGKMATLAAKLMRARGVRNLTILNRTLERASELADAIGGTAGTLDDLPQAISSSSLVIGAAFADNPIVRPEHVLPRETDLWLVDVSVPRVVDQDVTFVAKCHVRDVDALKPIEDAYREQYREEVAKVEALVESAMGEFDGWLASRKGIEAINSVRTRAEDVRDVELTKALRKLQHLSERDQNVVRAMASGLVNKMLHQPIQELRAITDPTERETILRAMGIRETDVTPDE